MDDWDNYRIFLAIARTGGLAAAAKSVGVNHSTVARHLSRLEATVGTRLAVRAPGGVTLTAEGTKLIEYAEHMEAASLACRDSLTLDNHHVAGRVRLATREGFGIWLVCPNLNKLYARHPNLELELVPEARTVSLFKRDADLAVTMTCPYQNRLYSRKLTTFRYGLFASKDYLKKHGPINKIEDLRGRPIIWYVEDLIDEKEQRYLESLIAMSASTFRATSMIAQQAATVAGVGIGILALFTAKHDPSLVRVLPNEVETTNTYWLSVHPDARKLPRIRAVIDFLHEIIQIGRPDF